MLSDEVIERFKAKIPTIRGDHTIYGITQLDIKLFDGTVKQIVLVFERLRVDEPETYLARNRIYADVLIKIDDQLLIDIASKEISIDDAIEDKMFRVYGDGEIWKLQLDALRRILPKQNFQPQKMPEPEPEPDPEPEEDPDATLEADDRIDFANLPEMDFSDVPIEFKSITDHFISLRKKYDTSSMRKVTFQDDVKKK